MPNPAGSNQFASEPAYGEVGRLQQLSREAPMSGAPMAASDLNAPRRSQKRAVKGQPPPPAPAAQPGAGEPAQDAANLAAFPTIGPPPYGQQLADAWQEIASQPGVSPLIQDLAARAERMRGYAAR